MPITYAIETITPAIAHKMLEGNVNNRNLSRRSVARYSEAMKRGSGT